MKADRFAATRLPTRPSVERKATTSANGSVWKVVHISALGKIEEREFTSELAAAEHYRDLRSKPGKAEVWRGHRGQHYKLERRMTVVRGGSPAAPKRAAASSSSRTRNGATSGTTVASAKAEIARLRRRRV